MANTDRISGRDLFVTFAGTEIHADFTSVSVNNEDDQIDVTAGADTFHYFLSLARENGTMDFDAFYAGTGTPWSTVVQGAAGTLIVAPKGTASNMPKWTWTRALVQSRNSTLPFDDGVTFTCTFQFSSALAETTY